VKDILELLQSTSIIFAALTGAFGIDAWRREFVGKRKMELAEEVLALCYETQEIIDYIRSPGGFSGEGESRIPNDNESENVRNAKNLAFIPIERHNQRIEKLSRLWALSYRFRAQFSISEAQPIEDLRDVIVQIKSAAHMLAHMASINYEATRTQEANDRFDEKLKQYQAVIWEGESDPDLIKLKVDNAVAAISATCKGVLMSKGTLFGLINRKINL
jgi:hypothetical protein